MHLDIISTNGIKWSSCFDLLGFYVQLCLNDMMIYID